MTVAVLACLAAAVVFAAVGPIAGRRLPPAIAVRILVVGSVLAAGAGTFGLAAVAFVGIAQLEEIAEWGGWSPAALRAGSQFSPAVSVVSSVVLAAIGCCALSVLVRRAYALFRVHRSCAGLARRLVTVLDSETPDAFTTPEILGRIVITTALLRALTEPQQRAVLAHERSHLQHRHSWWSLAADLAAGVNPLLWPTTGAIAHAIERWADEDAAAEIGDRTVVATAVAQAALVRRRRMAISLSGGHVPRRVRALLSPAPRRRPIFVALLLILLVFTAGAAIAVERSGDEIFDHSAIVTR